jgi:hypothetical protein
MNNPTVRQANDSDYAAVVAQLGQLAAQNHIANIAASADSS